MKKFTVIKKSAGYGVKSFNDETVAREYADKCCNANNNRDYTVGIWIGGMLQEI